MGVKLYGMAMSTNVARAIAVLNEKGVDYELVHIDIRTGAHKDPYFLSINPFGQIPALEDGDLKLFESRAITKYLSYKHKETGPDLLRLGGGLAESAVVEVWLEVEAQQFAPPIGAVVFETLIKPMLGGATDAAVVDVQAEKLAKVLDVYEERLSKSRYLAGEHFTLADLHHLPHIFYIMKTAKAELITSRPHVKAWWDDISARPAWLKTAEGMKFS